MFDKEKLDDILQSLVGSEVSISYVHSSGGEENTIVGVLEGFSKDVLQVKDHLVKSTVWINRHGSVLTSIRLLGKHKKKPKKKFPYNYICETEVSQLNQAG